MSQPPTHGGGFILHPITRFQDPHLLPWLDLYESAFPPHERGQVSWIIRTLQDLEEGRPTRSRLWALLDESGCFRGMAQTSWIEQYRLAYLGYFAVLPEGRGQGTGSVFYRLLLPHVQHNRPDFMLFDVERPDRLSDPALRQTAERRIRFYERLGAVVLPGVTFYWGESCQRMMAHLFTPLPIDEIIRRAKVLAGEYRGRLVEDEA